MHKKRKRQKKRKFVGLEWQAALSARPADAGQRSLRSCSEKTCESCASLWPIIRNLRQSVSICGFILFSVSLEGNSRRQPKSSENGHLPPKVLIVE
jgi:hypothetical protein